MCRLLVLSQPRATFGDLSKRFGDTPQVLNAQTFAPLTELFERVQEFLDGILDLLDIGAVTQPIANVLNQVTQAIQQLEQGLAQLTASARAAFEQADNALQALDLEAIQEQAEQALQDALQQVQQAIAQGLGPAANALSTALQAVETALNGFDPEQLTQPVQQVLDSIRAVFEDPGVQEAIQKLEQLKALADRLDELSFKPVSDTVISGIGTVKSTLDAIDEASLPAPGPELISEAMSVLPESLTPLTDPLIANLDELIEQGPIPLLEALRDLPKPIVEEMRNFSPRGLLEEPLGTPFRELREKLDEFEPTQWLDAAEQELDALRQRLLQSLDLGALLAPLAQAQQALVDRARALPARHGDPAAGGAPRRGGPRSHRRAAYERSHGGARPGAGTRAQDHRDPGSSGRDHAGVHREARLAGRSGCPARPVAHRDPRQAAGRCAGDPERAAGGAEAGREQFARCTVASLVSNRAARPRRQARTSRPGDAARAHHDRKIAPDAGARQRAARLAGEDRSAGLARRLRSGRPRVQPRPAPARRAARRLDCGRSEHDRADGRLGCALPPR